MGLQSVDFIAERFLLFLHFVVVHLQFTHSKRHLFALGVLIFICFEELALCIFVLLIVVLKIAEFAVEFV